MNTMKAIQVKAPKEPMELVEYLNLILFRYSVLCENKQLIAITNKI